MHIILLYKSCAFPLQRILLFSAVLRKCQVPAYLPNHSCEQKFALVWANTTSFAFASSAEVVSSFPSFPCFLLAPRSRSSTFGPCGCLHKMPRLFPGMQSSAGEASLLGSQASTAIAELTPLNFTCCCSLILATRAKNPSEQ